MATPLPVLPGVYYGRVMGEWEGLPSDNTFCFKTSAPPVDETADQIRAGQVAQSLALAWRDQFISAMIPTYTMQGASMYPLGHPLVPAQVSPLIDVGTLVGPPGPAASAVMIRHNVNRRGKGSQGRSFISPLDLNRMTADGKSIAPASVLEFTTKWNAVVNATIADLLTFFPSESFFYVQLSKKGAGATYSITDSNAESKLSTQRRRARRNS